MGDGPMTVEMQRLSHHIGEIYDAALDPGLWPGVLRGTCDLVGASGAMLGSMDLMTPSWNAKVAVGYEQDYIDSLETKYVHLHPLVHEVMRLPVGQPVSGIGRMSPEAWGETVFYQEWCRPQGLVDAIALTVEKSATGLVHLGLGRHESVGYADEASLRTVKLLYPHYRRAVAIGRIVDLARVESTEMVDTLNGLAAGVFLVDADMRLVHANTSGSEMLQNEAAMRQVDDMLASADPAASKALRDICQMVGDGGELVLHGVAVAIRGRDGEPYVAHVLPLTSGARHWRGRLYKATAAIFVRCATVERPSALSAMAQLYGLTAAETKVLVGIVEIGGVPAVAKAHGVSRETVRTHLKRVFEKTGTTRQADLVKFLAGIVSPLTR